MISTADDPMVRALLEEVLAKLKDFHAVGTPARIDLRRLPLPEGGLAAARDMLGWGEVEAVMRGVGSCEFRETGTAGVWWGTQRNTVGEVVGEFIEIADVPELLKREAAELGEAIDALARRLGNLGANR